MFIAIELLLKLISAEDFKNSGKFIKNHSIEFERRLWTTKKRLGFPMSVVFGDFRRYRKTLLHSVKPDPLFGFQITLAKEGIALNLATQTARVDYRILELTQGETEFIFSCSSYAAHLTLNSFLSFLLLQLVKQMDG